MAGSGLGLDLDLGGTREGFQGCFLKTRNSPVRRSLLPRQVSGLDSRKVTSELRTREQTCGTLNRESEKSR